MNLKLEDIDFNASEREYQRLRENEQLKDKEIERLNKCYCERTDCSGRIKNSAKFESLQVENERLNNILDNIGYQIEGIIRTTENLGITKYTGEVISKHNIGILKNVIKMIETKDVSIGSDKE